MQVGDLVSKKNRRREWVGIILQKKRSTRPGLRAIPELRYECLVRWLSKDKKYHLPENDQMWWGAWSLEILSASR